MALLDLLRDPKQRRSLIPELADLSDNELDSIYREDKQTVPSLKGEKKQSTSRFADLLQDIPELADLSDDDLATIFPERVREKPEKRDPLELLKRPEIRSKLEPTARALTTISQIAFPMLGGPLKTKDTERIEQDIASGLLASAGGVVAALPAAEAFFDLDTDIGQTAKEVADNLVNVSRKFAPTNPNFIDKTAMGVGSMALFLPVGAGGASLAANLPRFGTVAARLAPTIGTGISTVLESAMEAGSVFQDAEKKPDFDREQAADSAFQTFWQNLITIGVTNRFGLFADQGTQVAKLIKGSGLEGIQEGAQEIISSVAKKEPVDWNVVAESVGVGAIVGAGAKGTLDVAVLDSTIVSPDKVGPETIQALQSETPSLAQTVIGKELPVHPAAIQEAVQQAVEAKNEALVAGQNPVDAELAAGQAFNHHIDLIRSQQPTNPKTPTKLKIVEALEQIEPLVPPIDRRGIPIRNLEEVVATFEPEQGRKTEITHAMVLEEAEGLLRKAQEERSGSVSALETFVTENGGLRAFRDKAESEELRDVPLRFKRKTGLPADEMAQMAYDQGLLDEPSADLLREELKAIKPRGKQPRLGDFYDEAVRNLEEFASSPAIYGKFGGTAIAAQETARQQYRVEKSRPQMAQQPAYHGSPYKFEKFSLQKIGSGEGNQTFGWGLYFSGKKEVADYYRRSLSGEEEIPANVRLALAKVGMFGAKNPRNALNLAQGNWRERYEAANPNLSREQKVALDTVEEFLRNPPRAGHVYEVDIPEDSDYLDWDKPLSEQSENVKKAVKPILDRLVERGNLDDVANRTYPEVVKAIKNKTVTGEQLYRWTAFDPKEASQYLASKGVPGIRYLDQGSRITGEGTYNYVLFDDRLVKITKVEEPTAPFSVKPVDNGTLLKQGNVNQVTNSEVDIASTERTEIKAPREVLESPFAVKYRETGSLVIPNQKITSPADLAYAFQFLKNETQEHFMLGAVKNGRIVGVELVNLGTIDQVPVNLFDLVHLLDQTEADSYFLVHNHPSGNVTASEEDIRLTSIADRHLSKSGFRSLGQVIIDDGKFGFIDLSARTNQVSEFEHQEYAKTKKIPLLRKYVEWTKSKASHATSPAINSPRAVFELAKGIQSGQDEGMVFLLDTQNRILNALVVPKSQMNQGDLQRIAGRYRAPGMILVNAALKPGEFGDLQSRLKELNVRLLDAIEVSADQYRSRMEFGASEPVTHTYRLEDTEARFEAREPSGPYGQEYERARNYKGPGIADTTRNWLAERKEEMKEYARKLGVIFTSRLEKIDPTLKEAVRKFEFNYRQAIKRDLERIRPVLDGLDLVKKNNPGDWRVLDMALKNGAARVYTDLGRKYGINFDFFHQWSDEFRWRIKEVGFEVGYLRDYFPRIIRDRKGFLRHMEQQKEVWGEIEIAIRDKELEINRPLSEEEKVNLINSFIRGFVRSKIPLAHTGNMKTREIEALTPEAANFYYSSREALVRYIIQVNEAIEARKFFGRQVEEIKPGVDEEAAKALVEMTEAERRQSSLSFNNINDSIGAFVNRLLDARRITPSQQLELRNLFQARFGYIATGGFMGLYKNVGYMSTIANPIAAITQLEDLGVTVLKAAWNTPGSFIRALANRSKITLQDIGLDVLEAMDADLKEASKSAVLLRSMLRAVGFSFMDRLGKESFINAVVDKARSQARNGDVALEEKLVDMFGAEADNVIEDLKEGHTTENVLFFAFNELSETQPISLSEMPELYLKSPGARLFYQLKTFMVRRLDFLRNETMAGKTTLEKIGRFLRAYMILAFFGAGVDELKDFILGRKTTWQDHVIDNLMKPFGLSKYFLYQIREGGFGEATLKFALGPLGSKLLIDTIWKDVRFTLQGATIKVGSRSEPRMLEIPASIPIGGKLWYWWFGRGRQKMRVKEAKERSRRARGWTEEEIAEGKREKRRRSSNIRVGGL